jgi:hypothetical protein
MLEEVSLIKFCKGEDVKKDAAIEWFRYFVIDNHILLGLLEEPLGNDPGKIENFHRIS